jgi:four helix bundle protein
MAFKLEDFDAYRKAEGFWRSVTALLQRPAFRKERKLREQISDANDSILANFSEGFEQPTDRAFANFLFHAKGSTGEVLARLREAHLKNCITNEELDFQLGVGDEVCRLLAGLARYLYKADFKDRGRYKATAQDGTTEDKGRRTRTRDERLRTKDPGPGTKDPGQGTQDEGRGTKD